MMTYDKIATATFDDLTSELAAAGWDSTQQTIEEARYAVYRLIDETYQESRIDKEWLDHALVNAGDISGVEKWFATVFNCPVEITGERCVWTKEHMWLGRSEILDACQRIDSGV